MERPWAGYIRVSFVGGRAGESFRSPDDQARDMRDWARRRRERIEVLPPELDESGGSANRPILTDAIVGIEQGRYRGLVVAYLSRASRSVRHLLDMWERIEQAGGEVISVSEGIDTSTPAGRLTRTMLAAIAEHELDLHRERFEALRAQATAAGIWQRRQTPLGYRRGDDRRLAPDRDAPRVRDAFQARASGTPLQQIARRLSMSANGVRHLLANRVYLGELRVGQHVNASAHPALVDGDLFDSAQQAKGARPARTGVEPALLAGVARCAGCSHAMARGGVRTAPVYVCAVNHSAGQCRAPAGVTARLLDEHVEQIALRELARLRSAQRGGDTAIRKARQALREARAERDAYLAGVQAAGLDPAVFAGGLRARQEAVEEAERQVAAATSATQPLTSGDIVEWWGSATVRERNHVLRGLLDAVFVRRAGGRGSRAPLAGRVMVVPHGVMAIPRHRGGTPLPIVTVPPLDRDLLLR